MIEDGYPIFSKDEWKAEPGAQAGALILIEPVRGKGKDTYWKCYCQACGSYCEKRVDRLRTGAIGGVVYSTGRRDNGTRSCGCKQKKTNFKDQANTFGMKDSKYTDVTYGGVKILHRLPYMDEYGRPVCICECPICKKPFPTFAHRQATSCGCLYGHEPMSAEMFLETKQCRSQGEQKIYDLLKSVNVPFEEQKKFIDCADIAALPFDFYLESPKNGKYVIEFDGQQHFKDIPFFGNFKKRREHDLYKNRYCWTHNIKIIRIPYDAEFVLDDLSAATTRFLLTPNNEREYYYNDHRY